MLQFVRLFQNYSRRLQLCFDGSKSNWLATTTIYRLSANFFVETLDIRNPSLCHSVWQNGVLQYYSDAKINLFKAFVYQFEIKTGGSCCGIEIIALRDTDWIAISGVQ